MFCVTFLRKSVLVSVFLSKCLVDHVVKQPPFRTVKTSSKTTRTINFKQQLLPKKKLLLMSSDLSQLKIVQGIQKYQQKGNPTRISREAYTEKTALKTSKAVNKRKIKSGKISTVDVIKPLILESKDLPYTVDHSNKKPFRCKLCSNTFPRLSSLMFHNSVKHDNKLPQGEHVSFRCNVCGKLFGKHGMYIKHTKSHTDPASLKPNKCQSCDMHFEYLYLLKRHVLSSHSDITPFKCHVCGQHFGQKSHLERHTKKHEVPGLDCTHCGEQFPNIFALKHHQKLHGIEKPYKCHICPKTYHFEFHLRIHLRTHEKTDPLHCKICGKHFSRKSNLTKHNLTGNCKNKNEDWKDGSLATNLKCDHGLLNCNVDPNNVQFESILDEYFVSTKNNNHPKHCKNESFDELRTESTNGEEDNLDDDDADHLPVYNGADFLEVQIEEQDTNGCNFEMNLSSVKSTAKVNRIDHLNPLDYADRVFKCHLCPKPFKYMARFKAHIQIHKTVTEHYCKICNVYFSQKLYSTLHTKFHDAGKHLTCQMCSKSFLLGIKLQDHIDTHFDIKSYECKHCNKTFAYQRSLDVHMKKHSGVKPYVCEICNKSFVHKSGLLSHSFVHANIRTHQCNYCKKYFTVKNQVRRHIIRVHSRVRPHPCGECPMTFSEMNLLRRHQTTVHAFEAQISCDSCGRKYKNRGRLDQHLGRSIRCGREAVPTERQRRREDIIKLQTLGRV